MRQGAQRAGDTILMSSLYTDGSTRSWCADIEGAALPFAKRRNESTSRVDAQEEQVGSRVRSGQIRRKRGCKTARSELPCFVQQAWMPWWCTLLCNAARARPLSLLARGGLESDASDTDNFSRDGMPVRWCLWMMHCTARSHVAHHANKMAGNRMGAVLSHFHHFRFILVFCVSTSFSIFPS